MADRIITVTDPSVVTNDTLASYNNYTNQPSPNTLLGSMTIGEAASGKTVALTDGLVHEVTTKPVGTTNGEFAAVVSNAVAVDLSAGGWDIAGGTYLSTLDVTAVASPCAGISFNTDGSQLFISDDTGQTIHCYDLSTPWDVTSATNNAANILSTFSQNTLGLDFKSDGTKILLTYSGNIRTHVLSTPWDLTTAGTAVNGALTTVNHDCKFSPDGTKVFGIILGGTVYSYPLSTPWDVTTIGTETTIDISATLAANGRGVHFKSDGSKFYIFGQEGRVYQFSMTNFDISTLVYDSVSLDTSAQDAANRGMYIRQDNGSKLYNVGLDNNSVYEYNI